MSSFRITALAALPLLLSCSPLARNGVDGAAPAPLGPDAERRCIALEGAAAERMRITRAQWIAAGVLRARDPDSDRDVGEPLPAHCLVRGILDERDGADRRRYHTGFELRLPSAGNGRLLYQGGGGNDGVVPMAVGRNTGAQGWADHGLARGFATVGTDGGHQSADALFGLDAQAREEHAWRAHWRTATTARQLYERWYGLPPAHSYFVGCGGGGRQGLMFAQRFPELFDGVVASAPILRAGGAANVAAAWTLQQFAAIAPNSDTGRPLLARAFSDAQLARIGREIVDRCDAADGLADGIVADTALCRIDARRLVCPAGGTDCLSAAQAAALSAAMAGPVGGGGARLAWGWPWDPGIAARPWRAWVLGTDAEPALHLSLTSAALAFVYVTPPDPTLTLLNFDFERDPLRLAEARRLFDVADDVRLEGFRLRGGKLLLVHGMADPVTSALETMDFQRRVNATHGDAAARRFVRTFLVPGMSHCAGGPATDDFDGLSAIVDWVEHGHAPEQLPARGSTGLPGISRPLCPWPQIARFQGGDASRAESFVCR